MDERLEDLLLQQTEIEDVPENYQYIAKLIGVENLMKLAKLCMGSTLYMPTPVSIIRKARDRNILKEFRSGVKESEIGRKYGISPNCARKIFSQSRRSSSKK